MILINLKKINLRYSETTGREVNTLYKGWLKSCKYELCVKFKTMSIADVSGLAYTTCHPAVGIEVQ